MNCFWNLITFIILSLSVCAFMLFVSYFLGGRSQSITKDIPFESGIISYGNSRIKFLIKFYPIAIFFVIFDAEAIYIYIWTISLSLTKWTGLIEGIIFIFTILLELVYILKSGFLKLEK